MTDIDGVKDSISPGDIEELHRRISAFIKKNSGCVILLQRAGYLMYKNGFDKVFEAVLSLKDQVLINKCIFLVSLNPLVLEPRHLNLIRQEMELPFYNKIQPLKDPLYTLLQYIYNENLARRPVSYKNVSAYFSISKNTTGKRISDLEEKDLISVEKQGRYKLLIVTEEGRALFR